MSKSKRRRLHLPRLGRDQITAIYPRTRTITANYQLAAESTILADATAGAVTVTLPLALGDPDRMVLIKKVDSSANAVTVARSGSDTIDGATSQTLTTQYQSIILVSDGNDEWHAFAPTATHHPESHTVASHSDTTATGAELETLTDASDASALHTHQTHTTAHAHTDVTGQTTDDHHTQNHASRHATAGADPVAPADIGAATTAHTHEVDERADMFSDAEGDPAAIGTTADGTSTYSARRDHVHAGDHLNLASIGTNTHAQLDTHVAAEPHDGHSNNPAARVYNSANQSIANNTLTALSFDSERYDTENIHDPSASPSRLTCQTAGIYQITGQARFAYNASGYRRLHILLNGTTTIAEISLPPNIITGMEITTTYQLAVGDYLELVAWQSSGGNLNVTANANYSPEFMITRVA